MWSSIQTILKNRMAEGSTYRGFVDAIGGLWTIDAMNTIIAQSANSAQVLDQLSNSAPETVLSVGAWLVVRGILGVFTADGSKKE